MLDASSLAVIRLSTTNDFHRLKTLTFCYLCGQPFDDETAKDKDHVPPRACFSSKDRDQPVILPTHQTCNNACNLTDDQMGQLVSLLHGKRPAPRNRQVGMSALPLENSRMGVVAVTNIDLPAAMWRWIRAFYAALYRHLLPADGSGRWLAVSGPVSYRQSALFGGALGIPFGELWTLRFPSFDILTQREPFHELIRLRRIDLSRFHDLVNAF